ncbi:MAG: ATP-binding protein [Candidatus Izemoplasma sp.]
MKKSDIEYMDLAIETMLMTIPEPRLDGRPTPLVGAVIVFPNGKVDTAFRGELRNGDHAEYTLLDKKHREDDLSGSTLYATLEPCAPGARNIPKLSCAERIVNARIKRVIIGCEDPFPTVARKGIKYLQDNNIEVSIFEKEKQAIIYKENEVFFKYAKEKAEEEEEKKMVELTKIDQIEKRASFTDLSEDAINFFCEKTNISRGYFQSYMEKLGLYSDSKWNKQAILLFGKNPRSFYPQAGVKIKNNIGGSIFASSFKDYNGPMVLAPEKIKKWYDELPKITSRDDVERTDKERYPYIVFREGLINAIVHRDYDIEGAKIQINVTGTEISIYSPGMPVKGITMNQIRSFTAPSLSRNPKIAFIFNRLGLMEETGFGMETFQNVTKEFKLPSPIFEYDKTFIKLRLFLSNQAKENAIEDYIYEHLSEDEIKQYRYLKQKQPISKSDFSTKFKLSSTTAKRQLRTFIDLGLIRMIGASVNIKYECIV